MKRTSIILCSAALLLVTVLGMPSCDAQASVEKDSSICVATWNVQNLFNAVLDGSEYDEYRPESGWNQEAYGKRLSNAAKVIRYLPDSGELIVVLNEIEGPDVVEDLIKTGDLAKSGLRWYACTESDGSAVQTAVVSSIPISYANVHDVGDGLRPVLEVCFETDRGRLFILAVHFKSNIGGTDETAAQREAGARVAADLRGHERGMLGREDDGKKRPASGIGFVRTKKLVLLLERSRSLAVAQRLILVRRKLEML